MTPMVYMLLLVQMRNNLAVRSCRWVFCQHKLKLGLLDCLYTMKKEVHQSSFKVSLNGMLVRPTHDAMRTGHGTSGAIGGDTSTQWLLTSECKELEMLVTTYDGISSSQQFL